MNQAVPSVLIDESMSV